MTSKLPVLYRQNQFYLRFKSFWQSCFTLIAFFTGHGMRSHYTFQSSVLNAYAMNFTSFIKPVFKGIIDICMNLDLYVLHIRTWLLLRYTWFTSCWLNFSTWITALCGCITGSAPPPPLLKILMILTYLFPTSECITEIIPIFNTIAIINFKQH